MDRSMRTGLTVVAGLLGYGSITTCCRCVYTLPPVAPRVFHAGLESAELEVESDRGPTFPLRSPVPDALIISRRTPLLPKALDSMTNTEVGNYLRMLAYKTDGYSTQAATVPCSTCAPSDSTHVFIQPEAGMNKWDFDSIPPNGLVVGRVINDGPAGRTAANFGYPAQAKTWWVVDDDSSGHLRSRYFTRTYSNSGAAVTFVTSTRTFTRCAHKEAPGGRPARAKFWSCAQSLADTLPVSLSRPFQPRSPAPSPAALLFRPVSLVSSVPLPRLPKQIALLSNWVTCDVGCCASQ
jgi:hypothetical protein